MGAHTAPREPGRARRWWQQHHTPATWTLGILAWAGIYTRAVTTEHLPGAQRFIELITGGRP